MSSLLTAVAADADAAAFIVVPGDIPAVRVGVVDRMVSLWKDVGPWAAITSYTDGVAHPFLMSREALDTAAQTSGDRVLGRLLIESGDQRVVRLKVEVEAPPDVNTQEEYDALLEAEWRSTLGND
jgi:CTP:molybdopterin cytidylyltransferase MocA